MYFKIFLAHIFAPEYVNLLVKYDFGMVKYKAFMVVKKYVTFSNFQLFGIASHGNDHIIHLTLLILRGLRESDN